MPLRSHHIEHAFLLSCPASDLHQDMTSYIPRRPRKNTSASPGCESVRRSSSTPCHTLSEQGNILPRAVLDRRRHGQFIRGLERPGRPDHVSQEDIRIITNTNTVSQPATKTLKHHVHRISTYSRYLSCWHRYFSQEDVSPPPVSVTMACLPRFRSHAASGRQLSSTPLVTHPLLVPEPLASRYR